MLGGVGLLMATWDGEGLVRAAGAVDVQALSKTARTAAKATPAPDAALRGPPPRPRRVIVLTKTRAQFYDRLTSGDRRPFELEISRRQLAAHMAEALTITLDGQSVRPAQVVAVGPPA